MAITRITFSIYFIFLFLLASALGAETLTCEERLSDVPIPFEESIPLRPALPIEIGDPFLDTGELNDGILLPTGAVWQPSFLVWGTMRSAVQTSDDSDRRITEAAGRLDVYGNLYLTPTERFLVGIRPLDNNGNFTRYTFEDTGPAAGNEEGTFEDEFNADITSLFFEGDFGELFPDLDPDDSASLDYAFAVGRQPISYQDGMLVNDTLDALGISRINIKPEWAVNYRATILWAWDEVNRTNLAEEDASSNLYGVFNEIDFRRATVEFDLVYVDSHTETGEGFYGGLGSTQRLGQINSTFRVLGSTPIDEETEHTRSGMLLFSELSKTLEASDDFIYLNSFYGIDQFRSASRAPDVGGPLGATGILFSAVGLGRYRAALGNTADDAFGSSLGYQIFSNDKRQQYLFEFGGRSSTATTGQRALALGAGIQTALGRRTILKFSSFGAYGQDRIEPADTDEAFSFGGRIEWEFRL